MPRTVPEGWVSIGWTVEGEGAATVFFAPTDRQGARPLAHLAGISGARVADGYAGFNALYAKARLGGPLTEAACCPSDPAVTGTGRTDPLRASARLARKKRKAAGLPRRGCAPLP